MSIRSWLRRWRLSLDEDDFEDEIRSHLAIAEQERLAGGADREDARFAARREFGNIALTADAARRVWAPRWLESLRDLVDDVRFAVRSLAKTRAFAMIVLAVLAVGIALNATVFTVLKGLALTPLPGVERSAQLQVMTRETGTGQYLRMSYPDFDFLRDNDRVFEGLIATLFTLEQYRIGKGQASHTVSVEFVTGNYFQVLGVNAALGRTLLPSDEIAPGAHPVVVVGHSLWQRQYNGDPTIIGRTIEINRYPLTVVGVAAAGFYGTVPLFSNDLFIPIMMAGNLGVSGLVGAESGGTPSDLLSNPRVALLLPQGFLRPGVSASTAAAQISAVWTERKKDRPTTQSDELVRLLPFWRSPVGPQTYILPMAGLLTAMGSLVMLIACANIASLVLARGVSRRGELAARLALGAPRSRIVRSLVLETLVLVVPGTLFGVLLAQRTARFFVAYLETLAAPQRLFLNSDVDAVTVSFAALVAVLGAIVVGLFPALQTSRVDLVAALNQDNSARGVARGHLRAGLVMVQVAVSLVLLVSSGLVYRSFREVSRIDAGYDDSQVMVFPIDLRQSGYEEARGRAFFTELLRSLRSDNAIENAAIAPYTPLNFLEPPTDRLQIEGYVLRRNEDLTAASNSVTPDYFRTLRIGVLAGRVFDGRDNNDSAPVALVNRTFADRFWGSADAAIGKRIRAGNGDWLTVVGVVADAKYVRLSESPRPYVYRPIEQAHSSVAILHVRGRSSDADVVSRVRAHLTALDPDFPSPSAAPLTDTRRVAVLLPELTAAMLFIFGAAGLMLAAMGTYGLVSYTVAQNTREIGVRMALGASGFAVVQTLLMRSLRLGAIGATIGLAAAFGVARLFEGLLFGVTATDGLSYAGAFAIVIGIVMLATLPPAWRASRTNPLIAIRGA